mgnify:CR=1 FL=1
MKERVLNDLSELRYNFVRMNGIWIPQEIWALNDISPMQRILLSKIHALSHKDGSCWAGDDFLAESLGVSSQYIRKMRKELCETAHIKCEGYGHRRKMSVLVEATIGTSNDRNKQQSLQVEATTVAKVATIGAKVATTVAQSKEKSIEKSKEVVKRVRFQEPSLEEAMNSFELAGSSRDEGEKFWNYYEANGWKAGRNKMKNWNAAARNWIKRSHEFTTNKTGTPKQPSQDQLEAYLKHGHL